MWKRLGTFLQGLMATAVIAFVLVMASSLLPLPQAVKIFTVRSGSMEPAIQTGSLILVLARERYQVGDVVTVDTGDRHSVTHRIIEERGSPAQPTFLTKGDANEEPDPVSVGKRDIVGKTLIAIPYLGYPVAYAQTKTGFIWLILFPAALIILSELATIVTEARRMFSRHSQGAVEALARIKRVSFSQAVYAGPVAPPRPVFPPLPVAPAPVRRRKIV